MNKLSKILIGVCSVLVVVIFVLITQVHILKKDNNQYDTSMMNHIDVDKTLELFNTKDTFVVYIGREECDACSLMVPNIANIQKEHNYITQYLDITTVDRSSVSWLELIGKLDLETTEVMSENDKEETNTFGYFLDAYGYTPTTLIIKNGKLSAGYIGYLSGYDLDEFINQNI